MNVKYKTIENQINLLKSKGLKFKNEELARNKILRENYYFITKGYEKIFLDLKKTNNTYEDDTYFEELYAIYNFDKEFKNLLFDYINIIEINIKSIIAYEYLEKYGEVNILDEKNLNNDYNSSLKLINLKRQIEENIKKTSKYDKNLKEYIKDNGYLKPLVIVKYFMFGNIITLYSILKDEDKKKIAKYFKQNDYVLEKQLRLLNIIRNICAHGDILFNFKDGKNNIYNVMIILKKLLDEDDFYNMFIRIENLLICVKNEIDELSYNNLLEMMGFPDNYKKLISKGEKNMKYEPKPIDTSDIELDNEILILAEELAKNNHDIWASERIKEGWRYGTVRDDKFKTSPCLIPYDKLPESEKKYDRNTAIETLKLIEKLGFKIVKEEK